jgi:ubiquitin-like protein ATG12
MSSPHRKSLDRSAPPSNPSTDPFVANTDQGETTNDADQPDATGEPEGDDLPLTMAQSVLLTSLPRDTSVALATAGAMGANQKVTVRFHAIGGAPQLRQKKFNISANQRFESVVRFLGKKLGVQSTPPAAAGGVGGVEGSGAMQGQQVFCYVNSVFSPGLDEGVGNLWRVSKRLFSKSIFILNFSSM